MQPASYQTLGRIADALVHSSMLPYGVLIVGHTESNGRRENNVILSQRRADAIRDMLVNTFKIATKRVQSVGMGEEQFIDQARPTAPVNNQIQIVTLMKMPEPEPAKPRPRRRSRKSSHYRMARLRTHAHYVAIIEGGPDHAVGVWFPDLPGCTPRAMISTKPCVTPLRLDCTQRAEGRQACRPRPDRTQADPECGRSQNLYGCLGRTSCAGHAPNRIFLIAPIAERLTVPIWFVIYPSPAAAR